MKTPALRIAGALCFLLPVFTSTADLRIPLHLANPAGLPMAAEPVTTGLPFPEGTLADAGNLRLLDEAGVEIPLQAVATAFHGDGSIRWVLLDFQADLPVAGRTLTVEAGADVRRALVEAPLALAERGGEWHIDTGRLRFAVRGGVFNGLDRVSIDGGEPHAATAGGGPYLVDDRGVEYRASRAPDAGVELELEGPLRSVVTVRGWFANEAGERRCRYIARIHAYAGKPFVRVFYTWIMTEDSREMRFSDIGWRVPMPVRSAVFGIEGGQAGLEVAVDRPAWLVQPDPDRARLSPEGGPAGGRGTGWMAAEGPGGHVVVACRDFWQLFPKELQATPEAAIFHAWPEHGMADPEREVTDANLQYLWFAHEGRVLDFQVPERVYAHEGEHPEYSMRYVRSSRHANAMGVARTHELLLSFGRGTADPADAAALHARFQEPPAAMADPAWMCGSGVFGWMYPADDPRFVRTESMISGTFDAERRMEAFTRDYGMWNFGGGHTTWDVGRRRWSDAYRCWRTTHHGACRVPWLLYVRSGDLKYLRYAVRNTRKILDTAFVHWTNEHLEALPYPQGKIVGALNDYKGLVHWHSGTRLFDYNSMTDFALWYTRTTGDRWGIEVARQWGDAVVARPARPRGHREGAGTSAALLALYAETRDERYMEHARAHVERLLSSQRADGSFPQWENYAPWLERWWELTGDAAAADAIVRWADAYLAGRGDSFSTYHVAGQVNILAYAYRISGDPKYLARGLWELDRLAASVYDGEDPLLQGLVMAGQVSLSGYGIQRAPTLLAALALHGEPVRPDPLFQTAPGFSLPFRRTWPVVGGDRKKVETVEAWILQREDAPFTLRVRAHHRYPRAEWTLTVTAPDGAEIARQGEETPRGERVFAFEIPADGQTGIYRLSAARPGSYGSVRHPIATDPPLPVAFPVEGALFPPTEAVFGLWVPPGASEVRMGIDPVGNDAILVQLTAPNGARMQWKGEDAGAGPVPGMPVPDGLSGAVWTLHRTGAAHALRTEGTGARMPRFLLQEAYPADVGAAFAEQAP